MLPKIRRAHWLRRTLDSRRTTELLIAFVEPDIAHASPISPSSSSLTLHRSASGGSSPSRELSTNVRSLSKLPRPHGPAIPALLLRGSPDRELTFVGTNRRDTSITSGLPVTDLTRQLRSCAELLSTARYRKDGAEKSGRVRVISKSKCPLLVASEVSG